MDWNQLLNSLGTSVPVIVVLAWGWMRAEKRADASEEKRDADNKAWADRFTELATVMHGNPPVSPMPIDLSARLS